MANRKSVHLICNAHIDPVWLWEWEEGAAEAISTFRTAAQICEQNDGFVFNHNEAVLYEWVRKYEPALFKRIQKLVKQRKWHIMGGWYLQPDCNMPCGESLVRQILYGKAYFKQNFGVEPATAINFDAFGHSRGLVQILTKSGYDSYLFGRPTLEHLKLPAEEMMWVGYDGSEILVHRFKFPYVSRLGKAREKIEEYLASRPDKEVSTVLWGVGNHGGGPSSKDVRDINRLIVQSKEYDIRHSTPEAYFNNLRRAKRTLPKFRRSLNPWAVGCYASMARVKHKHRQLENGLYMAEKMVTTASVQGLLRHPCKEIQEVTRDLMASEFHDALPGSSIEPVEETSLRMLDHGLETAARLKAEAFFALGSGQRPAAQGQIPILVYNPHPFKIKTLVECEFQLADQNLSGSFALPLVYHAGSQLASQVEKEQSNISIDWRKRIVFSAQLAPSQMNRFDCSIKFIDKRPAPMLQAKAGKITFKTKALEVLINTRTGLVDRYAVNGCDCLGKKAFEPTVIEDNEDPWGMTTCGFPKVIGKFKLMSKQAGTEFSGIKTGVMDSVRIIEDGAVRSVVEAVFAYGKSFICQRYKLPKMGTEIELEIRVHWNEKDKMLKLAVPTIGTDCEYVGQVAYGVDRLPSDGSEAVAQKWVAVVSRRDNIAFTCINNGTYGSDFSNNQLRLTLLRSPAYAAHPDNKQGRVHMPQDRYSPRIDQGQRLFHFWFNAGKVRQRLARVDREALVKNEKPYVLAFYPSGKGKRPKPLAILSDDVVQVTAIKRAEKNNDLIIRLFEPTGRSRKTVLSLPFIRKRIPIVLGGFEIKTLRINLRTARVVEADLLERPV